LKLNPEQQTAVTHTKGPLLIFAGAGSGKTRVITNRIVHLVEREKVEARKIVALSFTNKSAKEMASRVRKMLPRGRLKGIELSTFHSLGLKMLKKYIEKLGYGLPFTLQTPGDLEFIISDVLKSKKLNPKDFPPKQILSGISRIKNTGESYIEYLQNTPGDINLATLHVYEKYAKILKDLNSVDFDDLILLPMKLLSEFEDVRRHYHGRYSMSLSNS
jgi:DNA helicase II / ATP-dependent DNA helicase PcrA